jgi:hypothetical protein
MLLASTDQPTNTTMFRAYSFSKLPRQGASWLSENRISTILLCICFIETLWIYNEHFGEPALNAGAAPLTTYKVGELPSQPKKLINQPGSKGNQSTYPFN